jgi:hypothetical protein
MKEEHITIKEYVRGKLTHETNKEASLARIDVMFGPYVGDNDPTSDWYNYPGFFTVCDHILRELEELGDLWYESGSGEVSELEPEGYEDEDGNWIEPEWYRWTRYKTREWKCFAFGELGAYL